MKKFFLVPLVILLVSAFVFGSCAKVAPAPAPAPAPTPLPAPMPAPAPAPTPAQPIKLRLSHGVPPFTLFQTGMLEPWAKMIKERTTAIGKPVEIVIFGGGAFGPNNDQYRLTVSGVADISGCWSPTEQAGTFPLNDVIHLPFLYPSATVTALVAQELFDTQPAFRNELEKNLKLLWFQPAPPRQIFTRPREVRTLEDFKGMKVASPNPMLSEMTQRLGGVPVTMTPPEYYIALERGLIDAAYENFEGGFITFKLAEITKYRTIFPIGVMPSHLVVMMNWDAYNNLPPEVQKIFNELSGAYMSKFSGDVLDKTSTENFEVLKEYDKKMGNPAPYFVPDNEFQKWLAAVKPIHEKYIAATEAKGLPGKTIYEDALRLIAKYSK